MNGMFGKDLTDGSIPRHLISFAIPIMIGNLLTTGYSIVNAIWVGKILGGDAVAAVAVCLPVILALVALASGSTMASSILISHRYGAKDHSAIQKIVNNSWALGTVLVLVITALGLFITIPVLKLLGTDSRIINMAAGYLRINIAGFVFMYLSFLVNSILRGIGDTITPMIFMIIGTVINAVLDPLFIIGIGPVPKLGLNGAAVAAQLASAIATVLGLIYINRKYRKQPVNPTKLEFDKQITVLVIKIGLPSFIQQMLLSLSYAFSTAFVNIFGPFATAAYGVAGRIDSLAALPAIAVMMSVSAVTAQNIGAGKPERVKEIFKWGVIINIPVVILITFFCVVFPGPVMRIFVNEVPVINYGIQYLRIVGFAYLLFIFIYVSNGVINGTGKTLIPMLLAFISLCIVRVPIAELLYRTSLGIRGVWFAIAISITITAVCSLSYYFSGKWKKSSIKMGEPELKPAVE